MDHSIRGLRSGHRQTTPIHPGMPLRICRKFIQDSLIRYHDSDYFTMPQLIVRNLEKSVVRLLKKRAGEHGVSMEEEHRRPLPQVDGLLAATAIHHNLTLVTRNIDDFRGLGLRVFNPLTGKQI